MVARLPGTLFGAASYGDAGASSQAPWARFPGGAKAYYEQQRKMDAQMAPFVESETPPRAPMWEMSQTAGTPLAGSSYSQNLFGAGSTAGSPPSSGSQPPGWSISAPPAPSNVGAPTGGQPAYTGWVNAQGQPVGKDAARQVGDRYVSPPPASGPNLPQPQFSAANPTPWNPNPWGGAVTAGPAPPKTQPPIQGVAFRQGSAGGAVAGGPGMQTMQASAMPGTTGGGDGRTTGMPQLDNLLMGQRGPLTNPATINFPNVIFGNAYGGGAPSGGGMPQTMRTMAGGAGVPGGAGGANGGTFQSFSGGGGVQGSPAGAMFSVPSGPDAGIAQAGALSPDQQVAMLAASMAGMFGAGAGTSDPAWQGPVLPPGFEDQGPQLPSSDPRSPNYGPYPGGMTEEQWRAYGQFGMGPPEAYQSDPDTEYNIESPVGDDFDYDAWERAQGGGGPSSGPMTPQEWWQQMGMGGGTGGGTPTGGGGVPMQFPWVGGMPFGGIPPITGMPVGSAPGGLVGSSIQSDPFSRYAHGNPFANDQGLTGFGGLPSGPNPYDYQQAGRDAFNQHQQNNQTLANNPNAGALPGFDQHGFPLQPGQQPQHGGAAPGHPLPQQPGQGQPQQPGQPQQQANDLMAEMQKKLDEANAANEKRYQEALKGYEDRLKQIDTEFGQRRDQILGGLEESGGRIDQLLAELGASLSGENRQRSDELQARQDARAGRITGNVAAGNERLEQGYGAREQRVLDLVGQFGDSAKKDIEDAFLQSGAKADQDLTSRGLGNTTIRSSVMTGNELAKQRALLDLKDRLSDRAAQYTMGLSGDTLGAQERGLSRLTDTDVGLSGDSYGTAERNLERTLDLDRGLAGDRVNYAQTLQQLSAALAADLFREKTQAVSGAQGDRLGFIERREDVAPDLGPYLQLLLQLGQSGALGGAGQSLFAPQQFI